jgi:hypothetical protein
MDMLAVAQNDGMILVVSNVVSASCPGASSGVVCRGPGSNCYGQGSGEDYYYTDCPQACNYTTLDSEPSASCTTNESAAQVLLAANRAQCESLGKYYYGNIVPQESGGYCVEDSCKQHSNCPSENSAPPALRKSFSEKNSEELPREASYDDFNNMCRGKPALFYDALGRRTEPQPETRRQLFASKAGKSAVREIEPAMEGFLGRDNLSGQCCVDSFSVRLVEDRNMIINDKVGIKVEFYAKFGENNNGCNPNCCEFKQKSKGYIFKNGNPSTGTTCKIDGIYVVYDSTEYVQDCYGRDCDHDPSDNREKYYNDLSIYKGSDFPGLNEVEETDILDIKMEFNSYIKDKCNSYEVIDFIYWGFHMQGPANDLPSTQLFGERFQ